MMQLLESFLGRGWRITFSSPAAIGEHKAELAGKTKLTVALDNAVALDTVAAAATEAGVEIGILIEDREPLGPSGAKGIGEPALVPTAPAILGAVHHATGVRVHRVPLLPHRLREAIVALERNRT